MWALLALVAVGTALLVAPGGGAAPVASDTRAAQRAADWLAALPVRAMPAGQQADAIVALGAAGRGRATLGRRLAILERAAPAYAITPGRSAKVVLAAVAAGRDPRRLGGVNYLRRMQAGYRAGRYRGSTFDQALAIVALRASGGRVPRAAVATLRRARGSGGWSLALSPGGTGSRDSVDATALVIEALRTAGLPPKDAGLRAGADWLLAQRNRTGGYASAGGGGATEANSTAGAIRALRALGRRPSSRTRAALRRLQAPDGGVRFTARRPGSRLLATNDAVIALTGSSLSDIFGGR